MVIAINTAGLGYLQQPKMGAIICLLYPFCFHITSFDFLSGHDVQCIFYIIFCLYYFYIINTVLFKLYFRLSLAINVAMLEMLLSCIVSRLDNLHPFGSYTLVTKHGALTFPLFCLNTGFFRKERPILRICKGKRRWRFCCCAQNRGGFVFLIRRSS